MLARFEKGELLKCFFVPGFQEFRCGLSFEALTHYLASHNEFKDSNQISLLVWSVFRFQVWRVLLVALLVSGASPPEVF